jgi:nitroreductase
MDFPPDDELLEQRYGGLGPGPAVPLTPVMRLMLRHRSVRSYQDRPLPVGALEVLIAAGQSGATSSNMQAVSVVAVEDPETRKRFSKAASGQAFVAEAPVILCFVIDQARPTRVGGRLGEDLWAIPLVDNFVAACTDAAIFAQNVLLAAQSMGLAGCYIGNLRNDPDFIAAELALPEHAMVLFGLALGYEKPPVTAIRPRLPQQVVLHRERYSADHQAEWRALEQYDEVIAAHEVSQGRPRQTWTQRHPARYASTDYLDGRIRLREILERLGFPLK